MASSSTVEGIRSIEMDIRFMVKKCLCGVDGDVKTTYSNKSICLAIIVVA
ncbi:hypothetical protein LguiB_021764 [Lonicera macranthoides]